MGAASFRNRQGQNDVFRFKGGADKVALAVGDIVEAVMSLLFLRTAGSAGVRRESALAFFDDDGGDGGDSHDGHGHDDDDGIHMRPPFLRKRRLL